jgi:uncharacterized protein
VSHVIDVHAHVGHTIASDTGQTYAQYLETMDAHGIERAILSVAAGGRQADGVADTMRFNDTIGEAMREHPDRFPVGLAAIEPRHAERAVEELERALTEVGLQGLVFHPMFEGFIVGMGNVLDPILELASEHSALCLLHTAGIHATPTAICEVAARYPRVTFIMGHPATAPEPLDECVRVAPGIENLYVDLAYQQDPRTTEVLVDALGPDRVLFGSDAPYYDVGATLASIRAARISDDVREAVLHRNGARLIETFAHPRALG